MVTRLVKSERLPMTRWEKVCIPTATEAAKSEPGRRGTEGISPGTDGVEGVLREVGIERPKVGS